MTLTACGPICDVGGEYILFDNIGAFSVQGIETVLHYCVPHKAALETASGTGKWEDLPAGPLRKAFEAAMKETLP